MVKIGFIKDDPVILAALGAKLSQTPFEKGSIAELHRQCQDDITGSTSLVNRILNKSGHKILGDFLPYVITLEDMSRLAALYFWRNVNALNFVFGAGLEASLRVMKPNRYKDVVGDLGKKSFELYEKAIELGASNQDARFVLTEATLTRMIFSAPPRYLAKIATSLIQTPLDEFKEIGTTFQEMVKHNFAMDIPRERLLSEWKFWGYPETKKQPQDSVKYSGAIYSISLEKETKGSLSMYAQLVRQRQTLCEIEPLSSIAKASRFVLPPGFPEAVVQDYKEIAKEANLAQMRLIDQRNPQFVYHLLLGQEAKSTIYGNGWGVIELSQARSEGVAQWEIRNNVGIPVTLLLDQYQELRPIIGPKCWRENKCTEPITFRKKKNVCKAFETAKGNWQGSLFTLMDLLKEPHEVFIA
jgi:hypothetical protein